MFAKFSLKARLLAAFGAVALAGAVSGAAAVVGLKLVDAQADALYQKQLLGLSAIKDAEIHLIQVARFRAQFARAGDQAARDKFKGLFEQHLAATNEAIDRAAPALVTERDQKALQRVREDLLNYTPHGREFLDAIAKTAPPEVSPEIDHLNKVAIATFQTVTDGMDQLAKNKEGVGAAAAKNVHATYMNVRLMVIISSLFTVGLAIVLGQRLAARLAKQMGGEPGTAALIARNVALGDLTQVIDVSDMSKDSVLGSMQEMQQRLAQVVGGIRMAADSIATASSQIASGNLDLSRRTESQSSSLQEAAATMDQLASTVKSNADTAAQAAQMASTASEVALAGGDAVARVVNTMNDITDSSRKISDIIGVIDGIAFQTNILALNAAVEAARAGEQGRGFAVVATEVRLLAQRSGEAAREIKSLITASASRVEAGSLQVEEAGRKMSDIVLHVKRVSDLLGEISVATREQTTGITQVGQAVGQLEQLTQQNAALVEESAAAAESLKQQADDLVQSVSLFRVAERPLSLLRP